MMLTVKTEVLEEETVSVTLNPPQTLLEHLWDQIRSDLHGAKSATNCPSHSTGWIYLREMRYVKVMSVNFVFMRVLPAICSSLCCEYYRPSAGLCVATTLYSLNYRPSAALCVATTLYSLNYRPSAALCVATTLYSLNYRPSAAVCVATTLYSLNYRPSAAVCVATTLYSLN